MDVTLHEEHESLWVVIAAPAIWALHFGLCYGTAAIWCARVAPAGPLGNVRIAIGVYTVVALAAIAFLFWHGWSRHRLGNAPLPHDADTPEDRHRFLGFTTMLLSGLSLVATVYVAMAAVFIETCQ
jgi:hypothetical protein